MRSKLNIQTLQSLWKWAAWGFAFLYSLNFGFAFFRADSSGTFGDTFGAVNAAFSGASLLMLIRAVLYQREELSIARAEREETRRIFDAQSKLNRDQQAALAQQSFEQSLYSLLGLISDERRALEVRSLRNPNITILADASKIAFKDFEQRQQEPFYRTRASDYPMEMAPCLRICGLLSAVSQLLQQYGVNAKGREVYHGAVRSLIDRELAAVWAFLILHERLSYPQAVQSALLLDVPGFFDYQWREFLRQQLQKMLNRRS